MRRVAQHAPELAAARPVGPLPGAKREILAFPRPEPLARPVVGLGEPVGGIGPCRGQCRILPGRGHPGDELSQPEAASLADRGEPLAVAPEIEGDLVWLADPVAHGDRGHGQNGSIYAA